MQGKAAMQPTMAVVYEDALVYQDLCRIRHHLSVSALQKACTRLTMAQQLLGMAQHRQHDMKRKPEPAEWRSAGECCTCQVAAFGIIQDKAIVIIIGNVIVEAQAVLVDHGQPAGIKPFLRVILMCCISHKVLPNRCTADR